MVIVIAVLEMLLPVFYRCLASVCENSQHSVSCVYGEMVIKYNQNTITVAARIIDGIGVKPNQKENNSEEYENRYNAKIIAELYCLAIKYGYLNQITALKIAVQITLNHLFSLV